jgi:hypothetical protein
VTDFVEECRREWKRLRVPSGPAGEMADDLAADLREAEAEGAFLEEVLGDGASDPRAFAEAWARERGLVRPRWSDRLRTRRALLAGIGLVGLLGVGAALGAILTGSHSTPPPNAATATSFVSSLPSGFRAVLVGSSISSVRLSPGDVRLSPNVPLRHPIRSRPARLTAVVRNSGQTTLALVRVLVRIDHRTLTGTIQDLAPSTEKRVTIALPSHLPARFTVSVGTLPVAGETNRSNNSAAWKIAVRRP